MKEAAKKTCLERYGVDHYINTEKRSKTVLKQSFERYLKFIDVEPLFTLDEYTGLNTINFIDGNVKNVEMFLKIIYFLIYQHV